ncbi:hypothetical protein L227DRAFT_573233 [Lentinus tigrinus ALCF2SS1-6]|uniref:DUF5745 domain-containing protein n=2 Tax=Lentinus tigrinus TaxID=5365 RepID=A0A5C2SHK0_9APHY|nr:hypothetical protein L227DRAFT_573233 [Lentinus tigrinus ALCF2SS1-6]
MLSRDLQRSRVHEDPRLVDNLNELIRKLSIPLPFALETPWDLTPGLLLGILESILQQRLPIPPVVRASRDFANKVQAMKIFLGVFENDILGGEDVGLSDVDPRRLATGEEDEVEFIGELLCLLGRQRGILAGPSHEDDLPPILPSRARQRAPSPSTHSTVTSGAHSNLSMMPTTLADTDTTIESVASEPLAPLAHPELPQLPTLPNLASSTGSSSRRTQPRCIHEVEDPSFAIDAVLDFDTSAAESSFCHCTSADEEDDLPPTPKTPLPFRTNGWIHRADENAELQFYYQRRSPPSASLSTGGRRVKSYSGLSASPSHPQSHSADSSGARRIITPHNAPTEYTLALLNERARLLDELAKVKGSPPVVQ